MENQQNYILSNGYTIPRLGYGTWKETDKDECINSVYQAILNGYRLIDCASAYQNEQYVGEGIRKSGIPRSSLFITSKVPNTMHGYENTMKCFYQTLSDLGTEYLDLYLIHWPVVKGHLDDWQQDNIETWRAMEELYKEGKIKAIGVSNFSIEHLENIIQHGEIEPMVNQIRLHPGVIQEEVLEYCETHSILVEAWSPLSTIKELDQDKQVHDMKDKYQKSSAQISLRMLMQLGVIPLTKTTSIERMYHNQEIFDFRLTDKELEYLRKIKIEGYNPPRNKMERD